jgi:hypothetical protein
MRVTALNHAADCLHAFASILARQQPQAAGELDTAVSTYHLPLTVSIGLLRVVENGHPLTTAGNAGHKRTRDASAD